MRIGVIGSHGVGKSSLTRNLSIKLNLPEVEEQMRKSLERFSNCGDSSVEFITSSKWYPHFVYDLIRQQIVDERSYPSGFVSDRTVLDYYLYYDNLSSDSNSVKYILGDFAYRHFAECYDIVFYLPIMFAIESDGFRNTDMNFQEKMDNIIFSEAKKHRKILALRSIDLDERVEEACYCIQHR